ncbi:MAG: serine/threonine-protein kinase, partial [Planctomycetota bacterium]
MENPTPDLSASELARLDAICMDFESEIRSGGRPSVEQHVVAYGGRNGEWLRKELLAIENELSSVEEAGRVAGATSALNEPFTSAPFLAAPAGGPETGQGGSTSKDAIGDQVTQFSPVQASQPRGDLAHLPSRGDVIGPYRIDGELGRGGMGVVFLATDTRLDRSVAIKMLSITGKHRDELMQRFDREAKAVARITHPNIVELFDVGRVAGLPYAVMEHLQGQTLLDRLRGERLSAKQVRRIGFQIADALATAHQAGVVHRDLKPHNVMMIQGASDDPKDDPGASLTTKLFDFGLSRIPRGEWVSAALGSTGAESVGAESVGADEPATAEEPSLGSRSGVRRGSSGGGDRGNQNSENVESGEGLSNAGSSRATGASPVANPSGSVSSSNGLNATPEKSVDDQTVAGMVMGTPGYMAPEQARGEEITAAVDVFSLGCVLHEAFYGKRAFGGPTSADRFSAALSLDPDVDEDRRREDSELADLISACLAKNRSHRPTALRVAQKLESHAKNPVEVDSTFGRRRFIESVAGGLTGVVASGLWTSFVSAEMRGIKSIGV